MENTTSAVNEENAHPASIISKPYDIFRKHRVAIYVTRQGERVRTVVALDGFLLNALMLKTGIEKKEVPKTVQRLIDECGPAFNGNHQVTCQVNYLIVKRLMSE